MATSNLKKATTYKLRIKLAYGYIDFQCGLK
jgi:hypothetical protein